MSRFPLNFKMPCKIKGQARKLCTALVMCIARYMRTRKPLQILSFFLRSRPQDKQPHDWIGLDKCIESTSLLHSPLVIEIRNHLATRQRKHGEISKDSWESRAEKWRFQGYQNFRTRLVDHCGCMSRDCDQRASQ